MWSPEEDARTLAEQGVEVWAHVVNAPGRYYVSNLGQIGSTVVGRVRPLNPTRMNSGYLSVGIYEDRGEPATTCLIHRLVVEAFDGPAPEGKTDVRHLDGNPQNNHLTNLCWGTRSENMLDVLRHRQIGRPALPSEIEGENWYQGYTADSYLVQTGLEFFAERKLDLVDLTRFWRCSRDVAANIVRGVTRKDVNRPEGVDAARRQRRPPAERELILRLIREGKSREEVNTTIQGKPLTHQDFYNYKQRV
jgi:hypothetical protein